MNKNDLVALMARRIKREAIARGIIPDPAKRKAYYKFIWTFSGLSGTVYADNRSDARAMIKRELGIPKKRRLPFEVVIERQPND